MPEKPRIIFHIDCNAFFASVEEVFHPELKAVPMAVCGDPKSRRGIILAKNQLAKGYGIKTAETIWQARQKCPQLTLRPARRNAYSDFCRRINSIYEQYTSHVERFSIDESYLDMTPSIHLFGGDPLALANKIRRRVAYETGITVSVGVSFNKIFAKLGSDMKKPDAVTVISESNYKDTVWPLPVSAMMMVGSSTERALRSLRIFTIGELAATDAALLQRKLGKAGGLLHAYANGQDASRVMRSGEVSSPKSIGNSITFKRNLVTPRDITTAVTALSDTVAARLRKEGMKCMVVQVGIKDANLKVITRQKTNPFPFWLSSDIAAASMEIINSSWDAGRPIRMLNITDKSWWTRRRQRNSFLFQRRYVGPREKKARGPGKYHRPHKEIVWQRMHIPRLHNKQRLGNTRSPLSRVMPISSAIWRSPPPPPC
jgi:DNA polymerase-4